MPLRNKKTFTDQVAEVAEHVLASAETALTDAKDKAGPTIADAREKAGPVIADARGKAAERAGEARVAAAPYIADAREKAAVQIAGAKEAAAPYIAEAKNKAAEGALATAAAATATAEKLQEEEPEPEKKKRGFFKKLLLVGGLAAIGGFVYSRLKKSDEDHWQSSYVPSAPPAPGDSDDRAGADPAESLSDTAAEPHAATTPDAPAEVVDVAEDRKPDPLTDPLPEEEQKED